MYIGIAKAIRYTLEAKIIITIFLNLLIICSVGAQRTDI